MDGLDFGFNDYDSLSTYDRAIRLNTYESFEIFYQCINFLFQVSKCDQRKMSKNVRRKLVDNQYSSTIGTLLHYNITPYFGSREICVKITFIRVCIIHTFLRHQFIICYIF